MKTIGLMALATVAAIGAGCADPRYATGTLEITYRFNRVEGVVPSYQTAVWLEDAAGTVHTLMVTPYLSFGGYRDGGTCRRWSARSQWDRQPGAVLDAVTQATPSLGPQRVAVSGQKHRLPPGTYRYYVETHLVEKYNILASGRITLGDAPDQDIAKIDYEPERPPRGAEALADVRATYEP